MSSRISMSSLMPPSVPMPAITADTTETVGLSNRVKLALLIGTPIVLGSGLYVYYRYYHKSGQKETKKTDKELKKTNVKRVADSQTDAPITDPFKRAMNFKSKGNRFFKETKYNDAIECYSKAIEECPREKTEDMSTFYQNRAASYEAQGKYKEVIEDCSKAIALNNRYVKALVRRAKALEKEGDTTSALFDITAVCILEQFQNQTNLLMTDRILREQSKVKAKELFKTRTPRLPSDHFIEHYFMSYSRDPILKSCQPNQIIEHLEALKAKQNESGDNILPEYLLLNGTIEILKGNIEAGEKELEQLVQLDDIEKDMKVNALIKLGTIKVQDLGREDSFITAQECFEKAIQLDADNPDIYLHRAQIHLLSEKVDDAYKDLETCCKLNDGFASALAQKLYVQFRCGVRYNDNAAVVKAFKGFENAMQKFPNSSEVFSLYAQALMERGEFGKADEFFAKAIEKDPIDGNLYVHRGILFLQSNNEVDRAIQFLKEGMKVDPNCQFAYEMLGSIQVQKGLLEEGIKNFDKALELAQTELDCAHLFSLRDAAEAQQKATHLLGIELPKV